MYKIGEAVKVFEGPNEKKYLLILDVDRDYYQVQICTKWAHKKDLDYENILFLKDCDIKDFQLDI